MSYRFGQPSYMNFMGPNAADVVGYAFCADIYCTEHILGALPTGPGQEFDGWTAPAGGHPMTTAENLAELAAAFGIDPHSADTDNFPAPVFAGDEGASADRCAVCHEYLYGEGPDKGADDEDTDD